MSRENWRIIKNKKMFYVTSYRRSCSILLFSLVFNMLLLTFIILSYASRGMPDFYATSGIIPPIQLAPLTSPNFSSEALLPPDPPDEEGTKQIPG